MDSIFEQVYEILHGNCCICLVFCRNNFGLMKTMDKGLTVPKCVLVNWLNIPQMPPKFFAEFVCPSQKVCDFEKKARSGCPYTVDICR